MQLWRMRVLENAKFCNVAAVCIRHAQTLLRGGKSHLHAAGSDMSIQELMTGIKADAA